MKLIMQGTDHCIRFRETDGIELMIAPFVNGPVLPVEHNIVKRDLSFPVFTYDAKQFILCCITLTALPEAHCPLGHHGRLAGHGPVTADNLIEACAADEVIV